MAANRVAAASGMIYLDYQATTPVAPEVIAEMRPWIEEKFANPHSPSRWGREAAAAVEVSRARVEQAMGLAGGRFVFTSGATEALNWALKGIFEQSKRRKLVTVATEHAAVLDTADWLEWQGVDVVRLSVSNEGLMDLGMANAVIDEETALVAAMLVNNEIGVIQPVAELARMAHQAGAVMFAMCSGRPDGYPGMA
jgi:cysteine desulfurase